MSDIQSIQNIIEQKNSIKEKLRTLDFSSYGPLKFGNEKEYTGESLYGELRDLLIDITTLTKAPKQFLKLSTHKERNNIYVQLRDINQHLSNPRQTINLLEELKRAIRPFHIRYTNDRLIEFDNELSETIIKNNDLINQSNELENQLEKTIESKSISDELLSNLTSQQAELKNNINSANAEKENIIKKIEELDKRNSHIIALEGRAQTKTKIIDDFAKKIDKRETQLNDQEEFTKEYRKKLEDFTKQKNDLLKTAEDLVKNAKNALNLTSSSGIGQFFQKRLQKLEPEEDKWYKQFIKMATNPKTWWLIGALIFAGLAVYLSNDWITVMKVNPKIDISSILARVSILLLPITGAWFCAGQYNKLKNIAEDYAYKTVLTQSMIGFSEHLKDHDDENDTNYQNYIKKILDEIHQHPLKNHKKHNGKSNSSINWISNAVKKKP